MDITLAKPLAENAKHSFFGLCLAGAFDVDGSVARKWLLQPNPNGKPNSDVLRPLRNGNDILKENKDRWVIDFGHGMTEMEAAMYEAPFGHVVHAVKPKRLTNNRRARAQRWWLHGESRPGMRQALAGLSRYIVTVETSKHRIFDWLPCFVAPEHKLVVIPREDDFCMGVLSSRIHVVWALAQGSTLEDRPVYTASRCFETFPFPDEFRLSSPADKIFKDPRAVKVAQAASALITARDKWLYPAMWVDRIPEVIRGLPDRLVTKKGHESDMKLQTLSKLYSKGSPWLEFHHNSLDVAVAEAYGWADYTTKMSDEEILRRLLTLNAQRT